jgi:hypothetical protein
VVAVGIADRAETELPQAGLVDFEDNETGEIVTVDASDPRLRQGFRDHAREQTAQRDRLFKSLSIDAISLDTSEDFTPKLHKFFRLRAQRFH